MTEINASEATVRAVAAAIGRAALFDDRITDGDPMRIAAWSEALEPHHLDQADMLSGVTKHYQAVNAPTIRPGDLIAHAREVRRDRAEREKGNDVAGSIAPPDPALGGLTIGGADGEPVWPAYDTNDAINRDCPTCGAPPEHACVNPINDSTRKIPCLSRTRRRAA